MAKWGQRGREQYPRKWGEFGEECSTECPLPPLQTPVCRSKPLHAADILFHKKSGARRVAHLNFLSPLLVHREIWHLSTRNMFINLTLVAFSSHAKHLQIPYFNILTLKHFESYHMADFTVVGSNRKMCLRQIKLLGRKDGRMVGESPLSLGGIIPLPLHLFPAQYPLCPPTQKGNGDPTRKDSGCGTIISFGGSVG